MIGYLERQAPLQHPFVILNKMKNLVVFYCLDTLTCSRYHSYKFLQLSSA